MYITNIRKKFGSFHYAKLKTAFDPTTLENYTKDLILDALALKQRMVGSDFVESEASSVHVDGENEQLNVNHRSDPKSSTSNEGYRTKTSVSNMDTESDSSRVSSGSCPEFSLTSSSESNTENYSSDDSEVNLEISSEQMVVELIRTDGDQRPQLKRKSVNETRNDTESVSGVGLNEPSTKNSRTTDEAEVQLAEMQPAEVQPLEMTQSIDDDRKSPEITETKPIIPKIEENISDFEEYLPVGQQASNSLGSLNQNRAQFCEQVAGTATTMIGDLANTLTSQMIDYMNNEISRMREAHELEVVALKMELETTRAEAIVTKKEMDQKIAEAQNATKMARDEVKTIETTLKNTHERNRNLVNCLKNLAETRRVLDDMQKMEKEHRDNIKSIENKLLEEIRGDILDFN